jgi:hypothetical protein
MAEGGHSLSRRLRDVGPQLKDAGIKINWPSDHGDKKVLTVVNTIFDPSKTKRGPSNIVRTVQTVRAAGFSDGKYHYNNEFYDDINFNDELVVKDGISSVTPTAEPSRDADLPPESPQPDLSSGSASSPNGAPPPDPKFPPGLHNKRKSSDI